MFSGIIFGFLAAFFQSLAYICTRIFTARHNNNTVKLLAVSHILMAVIALPLVVILRPETMPVFHEYGLVLFTTSIFYLLGQLFLFSAIIRSQPSRVSPLLGLKILMLAIISVIFFQESFSPAKWAGVLLSCISVYLLSNSGKKLGWFSLMLVLLACLSYSLSDLSIKVLVGNFEFMGIVKAASFSAAMSYILCGIFGLIILSFNLKGLNRSTWTFAIPFAISWFVAMICLFSCFGLIGVVFGNILQSTRGIISIVLGFILGYAGFETLDTKISRKVFFRRILAASLMTAAVVLFLLSS